ncbi:hypothetical protein BJF89_13670 [Corynebacterium sp. CNJ-954]|uniref:ParB/Srx family N-terminal domain-containing protein n=1 Tax=Corynebacterium sp. CNJ-954 TaxID=1904962 RepID=UPI00095E6052|nr:ParB/Srx family N-terminal domain-containing protein [Corynebacterium sp. CNJ-954]OLT55830.1 hypothetical protein BJF89_13670 [Corynebacterium sp. CNJ-954]
MSLPVGITEEIGGYPVHPVASMFPMIGEAELQQLADDIRENGQHEAIVLAPYYKDNARILAEHGIETDEFGGFMSLPPEVEAELEPDVVLIDGRNRMAACLLAGVEPIVTQDIPGNTSGKDSDSPDWEQFVTAWITSGNLHRRHLSKGQLAAIAVEIEKWKAVEAKKRQVAAQNNEAGRAVVENLPQQANARASDEAGAMLGVSGRSVRDAKYVEQTDPEMFEKIKAGQVAPSAAAKKIRDAAKPAPTEAEVKSAREALIQKEVERMFNKYSTPEERTLLSHYFHLYEGEKR